MTAGPQLLVRDPALYRVSCFIGWLPTERAEESHARLVRLERAMIELGLMPAGAGPLPPAETLAWSHRVLWDHEEERAGWKTLRHARSYHEQMIVLLGA